MELITNIITRVLLVLFILSCLNVIRHGYYFIQAYMTSTEESPAKYKVSDKSLLILGISLAYVLSVIFTFSTI